MEKADLRTILNNYEKKLCNKLFRYELKNNHLIDLIFYVEDFCHLIGMHYVFVNDKRYLGKNGHKLVSAEQVTVDIMRNHNEKGYNYIKSKIENFDNLHELLINGEFKNFDDSKVPGDTIIVANLVVYRKNKERLLHLFLRKRNANSNQYAPVSFVVRNEKERNYNSYIAKQRHIAKTKLEIIDKTIT